MAKHSLETLFVLATCFVFLPLLLADTGCRQKVPGTTCDEDDDKDIMACCLKSYTLGFKALKPVEPGQEPPSCKLDLGLAQCLDQSNCYAKVTNALRKLIFNQLVFTKRVGICKQNQFDQLLRDAKNANVPGLGEVEEMEDMEDKEAAYPGCAFFVYAECGSRFKEELQGFKCFDPPKLCDVFVREGNCNTNVANEKNCTSPVLTRFKHNSNSAAGDVLPALCSLPPSKKLCK